MLPITSYLLSLLFACFVPAPLVHAESMVPPITNLTDRPLMCYDSSFKFLKPTNPRDCRELAEAIMASRPWGRPWVFSTVPDPGKVDFKIPLGWKAGSCELRLVTFDPDRKAVLTDSFTGRYLAHQVNRWTNQCVIPSPHLGGEGELGPKKVFALTISGPFVNELGAKGNKAILTGTTASGHDILQFQLPQNTALQ